MPRRSGMKRATSATSAAENCRMGRVPAITMIANTNIGSVKLRVQVLGGQLPAQRGRHEKHQHHGPEAEDHLHFAQQVPHAGMATTDGSDGFGFKWDRSGKSSRHLPFDWSGPGTA